MTNVAIISQDSDGEKSDDLVVDVSNEVGVSLQRHFESRCGEALA